jgi:hypothetical protein
VSQARANLDVESAARRRALRASERAAEKRRIGYLVQAAVGWAHVAPAEALWLAFVGRLVAGEGMGASYQSVAELAAATGRPWPRSLHTIRRLLREWRARMAPPRPAARGDQNEYLDNASMN